MTYLQFCIYHFLKSFSQTTSFHFSPNIHWRNFYPCMASTLVSQMTYNSPNLHFQFAASTSQVASILCLQEPVATDRFCSSVFSEKVDFKHTKYSSCFETLFSCNIFWFHQTSNAIWLNKNYQSYVVIKCVDGKVFVLINLLCSKNLYMWRKLRLIVFR